MLFQKELQQAKEVLEHFKREFEKMRTEQAQTSEKIRKMEQDITEIKNHILKRDL